MTAATKKCRVAVVGVGYLGKFHAKIFRAMPDVELVAVVDNNPATAAKIARENDCEALQSPDQLAGRIDAASIAVPTSVHLPVARSLLTNGIHVMLEKPLAATVEESRQIVKLAAAHRAILQVGHLERFNPGVMKLAELAAEPKFIEVHRLGAFVERAVDVDVVADLMIHDIDIVLSLVRDELKSVRATGVRVVTDHVDIANARLEFQNGAVANVTASRVSREPFRRIRVFCARGYLALNFASQQLDQVFTEPVGKGKKNAGDAQTAQHNNNPDPAPAKRQFPRLVQQQVAVTPALPLDAELADFIDCVRHNRQPLVSGEAGLLAVQVAQQVRRRIAKSVGNDIWAGELGK